MKNNIIETIMGSVVLLVASFFLVFAYKTSGFEKGDANLYNATFDRIDGLVIGSEVRMSGVKVGIVRDLSIEEKTYLAKVNFTVDKSIKLPQDTSAEISSNGLLGGKYLALVPGGADEDLRPGATITHTQSAVNLEALIGQVIFSNSSKKEDTEEKK